MVLVIQPFEVAVLLGLIFFDIISSIIFPMLCCGFSKKFCDFYYHETNGLELSALSEVLTVLVGIIAATIFLVFAIRFILNVLITNGTRFLGLAILLGINSLWIVKSIYELLETTMQQQGKVDPDSSVQRFSESINGVYMTLFTFTLLKLTAYAVLVLLVWNEM